MTHMKYKYFIPFIPDINLINSKAGQYLIRNEYPVTIKIEVNKSRINNSASLPCINP